MAAQPQPGAANRPDSITIIDPLIAARLCQSCLARYRKGELKEAIADCDRALAIHPGLLQIYKNRSAIRWEFGDRNGAIADLNQILRKNPHDAMAFAIRGKCGLNSEIWMVHRRF